MLTIEMKKKIKERGKGYIRPKEDKHLAREGCTFENIFFSVSGLIFVSLIKIIIMGCACETDNYL